MPGRKRTKATRPERAARRGKTKQDAEIRALRAQLYRCGRIIASGELSGAIVHELGQPLTAILSNAQSLQHILEHGPVGGADPAQIVSEILADGKRAIEVIRRLRAFFSKGEVPACDIDANALLKETAHLLRASAVRRGASLEIALGAKSPIVCCNPIQIQQVILNCVLNALDAVSDNADGERNVLLSSLDEPDGYVISIRDNGHGIPRAVLSRMFKPFFTTKPSGMGLGLSISRSIIQAHNGRIWAENLASGGGAVHILLPRPADASPNGTKLPLGS